MKHDPEEKPTAPDIPNDDIPEEEDPLFDDDVKRRIRRWIRRGVIIGIPVLIVVVFLAMTVTFQAGFHRPELSEEDWKCESRVLVMLMQQTMKKDAKEIDKIVLTPEEVNSLLRFAVNADQLAAIFGKNRGEDTPVTTSWLGKYEDGRFHIRFIFDPEYAPCRFMLHGSSPCRYSGNQFFLSPENCRIGSLPIPAWLVRPFLPYIHDQLDRNKNVRMFHEAVETIETDPENRLIITYRPSACRSLYRKGFRR